MEKLILVILTKIKISAKIILNFTSFFSPCWSECEIYAENLVWKKRNEGKGHISVESLPFIFSACTLNII